MKSDDDVGDILDGHRKEMERCIPEWKGFEAAYEGKWWTRGYGRSRKSLMDADDGLPEKREVNMVWPFMSAQVSNLFYRRPTTEVRAPGIVSPRKQGRPKSLKAMPDLVSALCDEWLRRADVQQLATYAYQMALMYDSAAFKLGVNRERKGGILEKLWLDVLPRWECVWDDRVRTPEQQSYRGHLRWELASRVEKMLEVDLEEAQKYAIPDEFVNGGRVYTGADDGHRRQRYVLLFEFYDYEAVQLRWYLVDPGDGKTGLKQIVEPDPIPYEMPNGAPAVPIWPIVLSNIPRYPMRGVPAVRRIYDWNCEQNKTLTIVSNGMYRDAARTTLFKDGMPEEALRALKEGRDSTWVKVDGIQDPLESLYHNIELPNFAQSVPLYKEYIGEAYQHAQGFADTLAGRQLKYATAREVDVVTASGESTVTEIGARMSAALARTTELMLVVIGAEMKEAIAVTRGDEQAKLEREVLQVAWAVQITDAATTPMRLEKRRQDWGVALGLMTGLVQRATMKAAAGAPPIDPIEQKFCQLAYDYTVDLYELPDTFAWSALVLSAEEEPEPDREEIKAIVAGGLVPNGPMPPAGGLVPEV